MQTNSLATTPTLLKQINYARLLDLLRCRAPISRAELARCTGLTRSTVTVITAELIAEGLVRESKELIAMPGSGRPGRGLVLNPDGAFFIGAAIEVESLTVVELNLAAQVVQRVQEPIENNKDPAIVLHQLVQLIDRVRQANPLSPQRLRGIGLSVQGPLNLNSTIIYSPCLSWQEVDLHQYFKPHIDLPLFVDNDANAAALAEVYLGSAIQSSSLLYVLMNSGIGAGIVIHGRIWRGAYGTAGEVGSICLYPFNTDRAKTLPRRLNDAIGKETLLQRYRERGGAATDLNALIADLVAGLPLAQAIVQEWGESLGWALTALVNTLNPERVVLGGPLAVLVPYVQDQLESALRGYVPGNGAKGFFSDPKARFELSSFGEDAAAVGGAVLVYQSLFQVPDLVL